MDNNIVDNINNNTELDMNDSLSMRLNAEDKKYFNQEKDAHGMNAGLFMHKVLEDFKKNNIPENELNIKVDFDELSKSLRALEGVFNAVVNKSHTFVINNKKTADERILKAEEDLKSVRVLYAEKETGLQNRVNELLAEKDSLSKQLQEANQILEEHNATITALNVEISEHKEDINTLKLEKKTNLETIEDKNKVIDNLRIIEADCIKVKAELEECKKKVSSLNDDNAKLTTSIKNLENINNELNQSLTKHHDELTKLNNEYKELDTQFVALDRTHAKTSDKLEEVSATLADTKNVNKELSAELTAKNAELVKLEQEKINAVATVSKEKNDLSTALNNEINTLKTMHTNEINTLKVKNEEALKEKNDTILSVTKERDALLKEVESLKKKVLELENASKAKK